MNLNTKMFSYFQKLHSAKVQNDKMIKEVEEQKRKTLKTVTELNEAKQTVVRTKTDNFFCSKNVVCFLHLLHIFTCTPGRVQI